MKYEKMDPKLRSEIEKRRAADISYLLLTDEEILAEIRKAKSGPQPKRVSDGPNSEFASRSAGRLSEPFLREVFKFINFVKDRKCWGDWEWYISRDGKLVFMGSWRLEVRGAREDSNFSNFGYQNDVSLPKDLFDPQPEGIKWPRRYEMRKGSGIHRLLKILKRKKVLSLKRKNGQWWLQIAS